MIKIKTVKRQDWHRPQDRWQVRNDHGMNGSILESFEYKPVWLRRLTCWENQAKHFGIRNSGPFRDGRMNPSESRASLRRIV